MVAVKALHKTDLSALEAITLVLVGKYNQMASESPGFTAKTQLSETREKKPHKGLHNIHLF
jgi:hypothetical protein